MVTPDGWTVEVVDIDGHFWYRVKRDGYLYGGQIGRRHGLYRTAEDVEKVMGASFKQLAVPDRPTDRRG